MPDRFAVIFHQDLKLDVPSVATAISGAMNRNIYDARHLARNARGIVADHLSREEADALVAALTALQVECALIPQADLPILPAPHRIQAVECGDDMLRVKHTLLQPEWSPVPWDKIVFAHVGIVATSQYRDFFTSKEFKAAPMIQKIDDPEIRKEVKERLASRALRRQAAQVLDLTTKIRVEKEEISSLHREQTQGFIDLLLTDPLQRLRIDRHDCHFDYLGDRMKPTSFENFHLLAEDMLAHASKALVSDLARAFRDGLDVHRIIFDSVAEMERYETWTLLMAGRKPAAPPTA